MPPAQRRSPSRSPSRSPTRSASRDWGRRTCRSRQHANRYPTAKGSHEKGWTAGNEADYEAGGNAWGGFDAASIDEKRNINERYRTSSNLRNVYSLYRWKANWDGKLNDEPLFFPVDGATYIPSPWGVEILDSLPLYAEVDYSTTPPDIDESTGLTLRKPVLSLRKRNDDNTLASDRIYIDPSGRLTLPEELLKSRPFGLRYEIENLVNLRFVVTDAPQHAIAGKSFVGNAGDLDQGTLFGNVYHGGWDLTIAIRGDRRVRYAIPQDVSSLDVVRRKIVTLDDESLASIYITKGAVVGWKNDTPNTTKSPGGLLRDPTPILRSICQMLAKQHGQPRRRATIRTGRRLPQWSLGSLLRNVESASGPIAAPICEIRIEAPAVEGDGDPSPPTQSFIASPYRADVLSLLRTPTGNAAKRKSRKGTPRTIVPRDQRRRLVPRDQRRPKRK